MCTRSVVVATVLMSCAQATERGNPGPEGPQGPPGPAGPAGTLDPDTAIANGTTPQIASFNITGDGAIGSTLSVGGPIHATETWGLNARGQGLMVIPEGPVFDDGAGSLVLTQTVIVMNPASGSWLRVAPGTYTLGAWAYLYVDLPPVTPARATAIPQIGVWTDTDRAYDHPDRLVLAQRQGAGSIFLNFRVPTPAVTAPQTLVTMVGPNLGDVRVNAGVVAPATWFSVPNRAVAFTKHTAGSRLRITYQDTLGAHGRLFAGCEWRIVLDGNEVAFFSDADADLVGDAWRMHNAAHVAWATAGVGAHAVQVQNRGNRGAWGAGTNECLQGWNTTSNFLSVEEIP